MGGPRPRVTRRGHDLPDRVDAVARDLVRGALEERLDGLVNTRLEVIPRADHFFVSGLAELARLVEEWL